MIGQMLDTMLTVVEENRVLCTAMKPGSYTSRIPDRGPCLLGTIIASDAIHSIPPNSKEFLEQTTVGYLRRSTLNKSVGEAYDKRYLEAQYDQLCERFGIVRINNAIRNRILANKVERALAFTHEEQYA